MAATTPNPMLVAAAATVRQEMGALRTAADRGDISVRVPLWPFTRDDELRLMRDTTGGSICKLCGVAVARHSTGLCPYGEIIAERFPDYFPDPDAEREYRWVCRLTLGWLRKGSKTCSLCGRRYTDTARNTDRCYECYEVGRMSPGLLDLYMDPLIRPADLRAAISIAFRQISDRAAAMQCPEELAAMELRMESMEQEEAYRGCCHAG